MSGHQDAGDTHEISALAHRVHNRIRDAHRKCDPTYCALAAVWVEDVQEILDAAGAES